MIKLNYTSLQHPVEPVEVPEGEGGWQPERRPPVLVCFLHGHLAPAAWAAAQAAPGLRLGYVQTAGGALPGSLSRDVAELRERGLLCGHITAGPAYGGEHEAISVPGALHAAAEGLGWDAIVAPGPASSARPRATATAGWRPSTAPTPRWPSDCRRSRRGSRPATRGRATAASATTPRPCCACCWRRSASPRPKGSPSASALAEVCGERHRLDSQEVDLAGYAASGLPARTMGRGDRR